MELHEQFDPHALDWSRHNLQSHETERGPGVFLADVVSKIGADLLEAWHGHETAEISLPAAADLDIPPPGLAFDDDGEPVAAMHESHGPYVREALRLEAERPSSSSMNVMGDQERLSPSTRSIAAGDPSHGGCSGSTRRLSAEDWEWAYEAIVFPREQRSWAKLALGRVAEAIADMASMDEHDEGAIRLIGRPLLGGLRQDLDRSIWQTGPELRMRRLAACGLNADAPFDPAAPITHLIFVDHQGLDEAIEAYCSVHRILAIDDVDDRWFTTPEKKGWAPKLENEVRDALIPVLLKPENEFWRLAQAQRYIANHQKFGSGFDEIVARVCSALKKEAAATEGMKYASLGRSGRPRFGLELVRKR